MWLNCIWLMWVIVVVANFNTETTLLTTFFKGWWQSKWTQQAFSKNQIMFGIFLEINKHQHDQDPMRLRLSKASWITSVRSQPVIEVEFILKSAKCDYSFLGITLPAFNWQRSQTMRSPSNKSQWSKWTCVTNIRGKEQHHARWPP